jgi:hypothetical protein
MGSAVQRVTLMQGKPSNDNEKEKLCNREFEDKQKRGCKK